LSLAAMAAAPVPGGCGQDPTGSGARLSEQGAKARRIRKEAGVELPHHLHGRMVLQPST